MSILSLVQGENQPSTWSLLSGEKVLGKISEPFTPIPNRVLRSPNLDPYDKLIFALIASCNPSFPSYTKLMEWSGMSRERVWKSLRNLENINTISRFRKGRSTVYVHYLTSSPDEPIGGKPVRFANRTSSPDEPISVRQTNSNQFARRTLKRTSKNPQEKEEIKKGSGSEETYVSSSENGIKNLDWVDTELLEANRALLLERERIAAREGLKKI